MFQIHRSGLKRWARPSANTTRVGPPSSTGSAAPSPVRVARKIRLVAHVGEGQVDLVVVERATRCRVVAPVVGAGHVDEVAQPQALQADPLLGPGVVHAHREQAEPVQLGLVEAQGAVAVGRADPPGDRQQRLALRGGGNRAPVGIRGLDDRRGRRSRRRRLGRTAPEGEHRHRAQDDCRTHGRFTHLHRHPSVEPCPGTHHRYRYPVPAPGARRVIPRSGDISGHLGGATPQLGCARALARRCDARARRGGPDVRRRHRRRPGPGPAGASRRVRERGGPVGMRQEHVVAAGVGTRTRDDGGGARRALPARLRLPGPDAAAVADGGAQRRAARRAGGHPPRGAAPPGGSGCWTWWA